MVIVDVTRAQRARRVAEVGEAEAVPRMSYGAMMKEPEHTIDAPWPMHV